MKHRLMWATAAILTVIYCPAHADSPVAPQPYTLSLDGSLFVMLSGHCEKHTESHSGLTEPEYWTLRAQRNSSLVEKIKSLSGMHQLDPCAYENAITGLDSAIRNSDGKWKLRVNTFRWKPETSLKNSADEAYPASGLYPANGSVTPIWSVDWHAPTVYLSGDGRYLVRMGPWAQKRNDLAVAFYDRGKILRAYAIDDLVRNPDDLPRSISHFRWQRQVNLDDENGSFCVATLGNEIHEFDITTGRLTSSEVIESSSFTVEAESLSGKHYTLSDFESASARQYIFGWETIEPDRGDGKSMIREFRFPFSEIARITRTDDSNNDAVYWRIRLRSGDEHVIQVREPGDPPYRLTGKTSSGETLNLPAQDINRIVFR